MLLLDIRNLTIEFITKNGALKVVDRVSMSINEGEILGLVGESGSGKSLIAQAICGIIKDNCRIQADRFRFMDIDLLKLSIRQRRKVIGKYISIILQDPKSCLDPTERIGRQISRVITPKSFKGHWWQWFSWRQRRTIELLHRVGIKDHQSYLNCYPYELTEGECQQIMIAIALANKPKLLIADDPTNMMEPITQTKIFRLLTQMNQNNNTSILLISHELEIMHKWTTRISVMYSGQMVEFASCNELISSPNHPYTQALVRSMFDFIRVIPHKSYLNALPGSVPPLDHLPIGCRFGPRCSYAQKKCMETPLLKITKGRAYACHFPLNDEEAS